MNSSPTGWIALTLVCVSVVAWSGLAAAQIEESSPPYEAPADRQWDTGQCYALMVKKLYAATDETDPLQEGYLLAAEAYRKLGDAGQRCQ